MPGDGTGNGNGGKGAGNEEIQQLQEQLSSMKEEFGTLKQTKADLESKLDEAHKELLSEDYLNYRESKSKGGGKPKGGGEIDLETASPAEIASHLEDKYKGDLDKAVNDVTSKINAMDEKLGLAFAQMDIAVTSVKYPDFKQHQKEIVKVAKENPTWGAERCYKEFKSKQRLKELDDEDAAKKKAEEERKALSEKGGMSPHVTKEKDLSPKEAAERAYRASFGNEE